MADGGAGRGDFDWSGFLTVGFLALLAAVFLLGIAVHSGWVQ